MDDGNKRKSPLAQKLKKLVRHKLFIVLAVFLLLVGGAAGWAYYYFLIPNPTVHKELDDTFGAEFFEDFHLEYDYDIEAVEVKEEADSGGEDEESAEEGKEFSRKDEKDGENEEGEKSPLEKEKQGIEDQQKVPEEISKEDIVDKHRPRFNSLQEVALERLDTLYDSAVEEYLEQREAGKVNRSKLAQKYVQAGKRLENNVDERFDEMLGEMKKELEKHGFSTAIISRIKQDYEDAKFEARREYLELYY